LLLLWSTIGWKATRELIGQTGRAPSWTRSARRRAGGTTTPQVGSMTMHVRPTDD